MEKTLKITNVLSDPTRFHIYQYITKQHQDVTVQEIAENFDIHPNVARLHLSKLEDVNMLRSETRKTGKGGRPSRLYRLSDDVIQLNFPFRDYQLLTKILIETFTSLGKAGEQALYETGKKFGAQMMQQEMARNQNSDELTFEQKVTILRSASTTAGFYPEFDANEEEAKIYFQIFNCPFKEVAVDHSEMVCNTHQEFLKGMFEVLFDSVELVEKENMLNGCSSCAYQALVTK